MNKLEESQKETLYFMIRVINARKKVRESVELEIKKLKEMIEFMPVNGLDPVMLDRLKTIELNRGEEERFANDTVGLRKDLIEMLRSLPGIE